MVQVLDFQRDIENKDALPSLSRIWEGLVSKYLLQLKYFHFSCMFMTHSTALKFYKPNLKFLGTWCQRQLASWHCNQPLNLSSRVRILPPWQNFRKTKKNIFYSHFFLNWPLCRQCQSLWARNPYVKERISTIQHLAPTSSEPVV